MALEIEKKYRLRDREAAIVAARLRALGAEFAGRDFEENIVFSNDDLRGRDSIARLRRIGRRTLLTFKRGTTGTDDIKTHIEYETEVTDFDSAAAILGELGLRPVLVYEKRRETWRFREVLVMLDELPFGDFAEIEGNPASIERAEQELDAGEFRVEPKTYPQLTAELGERSNDVIEARFEKREVDDRHEKE